MSSEESSSPSTTIKNNTESMRVSPVAVSSASPTLLQGLTTCIVGGGNSAHVLIPLLSEAGHRVHLLTRRPEAWSPEGDDGGAVFCDDTDGNTGEVMLTREGRIDRKSSDPADVIPDADVVVLCMPVHQYRPALARIAPFINREKEEVFVGTVFGQAGFDWMVRSDVVKACQLNNVVAFAIGSIPWICRTTEYGRRGACYGPKVVNTVAVSPSDKFHKLDDIFLNDISYRPYQSGKFRLGEFLDMTLTVDNQIIHPGRCYGLHLRYGGEWPTADDVPYFYRDFDEISADALRKLDDDYTKVREAVKKRFPNRDFRYMLSYLEMERLNHGSSNDDILVSLRDSRQLASIKTPAVEEEVDVDDENGEKKKKTVWRLNRNHRFFDDDIPYGLLIAKWMGEKLGVETPFVDEVIVWAQRLTGRHYLDENTMKIDYEYCLGEKYASGIPDSYGISGIEGILD